MSLALGLTLAGGATLAIVEKMEKHCKAIVDAAEKVTLENEKAADLHTLRGRELQGKRRVAPRHLLNVILGAPDAGDVCRADARLPGDRSRTVLS